MSWRRKLMFGSALLCVLYSVFLAGMHWYEWSALFSPDKRISTSIFLLIAAAFGAVAVRVRRGIAGPVANALVVFGTMATVGTLPGRILLIRQFGVTYPGEVERETHNALRLLISAQEDARIRTGAYSPRVADLSSQFLGEIPKGITVAIINSNGAESWSGEAVRKEDGFRCVAEISSTARVRVSKGFFNDDVRCNGSNTIPASREATSPSTVQQAAERVVKAVDSTLEPGEWTQERANLDQNAVVASDLPGTSWTTSVGHQIRAGASIVGNRILVGGHGTGWLGSIDARTGAIVWTTRVPTWVHQDPVSSEGIVVVGVGDKGHLVPAGRMGLGIGGAAAYDLGNGQLRWFKKLDGGVMVAPAIWHGTVIVPDGARNIQALRLNDGEVLWKSRLPGQAVMASPLIRDSTIFIASAPRYVCAFDARSGTQRWCYDGANDFSGGGDATASVINGTVYWSAARAVPGVLTLRKDMKAVGKYLLGRIRGQMNANSVQWVVAIDAETGKARWRQELGSGYPPKGNISGTAVPFRDKILINAPLARALFSLDTATGRMRWRRDGDAFNRGAVTVVDSTIITTDEAAHLHILRATDGGEICSAALPDAPDRAGPVVAGPNVIFTGLRGTVFVRPLESVLHCDVKR